MRALVHSRTLVTAGLIILFNFFFQLLNFQNLLFLLVVSLFTILISRLISLFEKDLKKVVALRTISQIAFCVLVIRIGLGFLSFFHILRHAFFKSCLFVQVGFLIFYFFGQQDYRYFFINKWILFLQFQFLYCLFCLCGLLFRRGFFSKDLILEFIFSRNWFLILLVLFLLSVWITFLYSYNLWLGLFYTIFGIYINLAYLIFYIRLFLFLISIGFIWGFFSNFLIIPRIFLFLDFYFFCYLLVYFYLYYLFLSFGFWVYFIINFC